MSSPNLNLTLALVGSVAGTSPITGTSLNEAVNVQQLLQLLAGTGAGQADTILQQTGSIAASGTLAVDLNGAATDVFGATVNLLHVKAIILLASSANTNDVQISPGASNAFTGPFSGTTPAVAVSPGEMFLITKGSGSQVGWPVVAATGDILKLANSGAGTAVGYTLIVIGTST